MEFCSQMRTKWTSGSILRWIEGWRDGFRRRDVCRKGTQTGPLGERVIDEVIISSSRRSELV